VLLLVLLLVYHFDSACWCGQSGVGGSCTAIVVVTFTTATTTSTGNVMIDVFPNGYVGNRVRCVWCFFVLRQ
jgi:hypothetical protein